jgi:DMSO/TMAO reductase YedYZ molybdopterin-dependent catalytic subunit
MKKFKIVNLLIIILLVISIGLSGCRSKKEASKDIVNVESEQETFHEEANEQEIAKEESNMEEEREEETHEKEQKEEIQEKEDTVEEVTKKSETSSKKKETTNATKKDKVEKTGDILKVEGKVGNKLDLSLNELKAMESIIFQGEYYSINNFGTTNHTKFKGVNLWKLLEQAKVSSAATKVTIMAIDGYKMEFTIDQVKRQDYIDETNPDKKLPMIIAWEENGEEYDLEEGPPFKLVVGQKEAGDVNKPQWVSNIDRIIVE